MNKRGCGTLLHISSLPSPYGIGSFGETAYQFVDFLVNSHQKYWQILPLTPTTYGDSPYQSFSIYAGNPYFIDLDTLVKEKLLLISEIDNIDWGSDETSVDYGKIYENRFKVLRIAYARFKKDKEYYRFLDSEKSWLDDYSLFMAIKEKTNKSWNNWENGLKSRDKQAITEFKQKNSDEIDFWNFVQYKFYSQWRKLKEYANKNGIKIIGDIPIYVAYDSVDVWSNTKCFKLNANLQMTEVAGCPPDAFSKTGQLWGNPLYNWNSMRKDKYSWWINRIKFAKNLYDIVRVDHFRGFVGYYGIKASSKTAIDGKWYSGPGIRLFQDIKKSLGNVEMIAEDLGLLTDDVRKVLKETNFPGMKVFQFAFSDRTDDYYLPHNYIPNSVTYLGTHDNDTTKGWLMSLDKEHLEYIKEYFGIKTYDINQIVWEIIKEGIKTVSNTTIISMQDYLCLGSTARMNTPAKSGGNWCWRMKRDEYLGGIEKDISKMLKLYHREEKPKKIEKSEEK